MKNNKGFTLIELLVVVAIIGILAAVGTVAYQGYTKGAKKNATKSNHASVTKFIAAELAKCNMGEANVMQGSAIAADTTAGTEASDGAYACDGTDLTVSAAAENALSDFKNTYAPANPAVVASATLVLGQTNVSDAAGIVTIETCFDVIGTSDPQVCTTGDSSSTMKNTVTVE